VYAYVQRRGECDSDYYAQHGKMTWEKLFAGEFALAEGPLLW
jgi:hypothetical protein